MCPSALGCFLLPLDGTRGIPANTKSFPHSTTCSLISLFNLFLFFFLPFPFFSFSLSHFSLFSSLLPFFLFFSLCNFFLHLLKHSSVISFFESKTGLWLDLALTR